MDLTYFCKSSYVDYLSKYERDYLVKNGRFHNVANVKKQLSKQFKNVSIRGRGKNAIVYVGKSRVMTNEAKTLQDVLIRSIISQLDDNGHSLSQWGRKLGIAIMFPPKRYLDTLSEHDEQVIIWLLEFVRKRQRSYFEKAYRRAINAVGGVWSIVEMGRTTEGEIVRIDKHDSEKLLIARKELLGKKGVIAINVREQVEYKELLRDLGFRQDWSAYLATYNCDNQEALMNQGDQVSWQQVNKLFRAELLSDLKAKIAKQRNSEEVQELIDLGVITPQDVIQDLGVAAVALDDGTMLNEWEKFQSKLIVDDGIAGQDLSKSAY